MASTRPAGAPGDGARPSWRNAGTTSRCRPRVTATSNRCGATAASPPDDGPAVSGDPSSGVVAGGRRVAVQGGVASVRSVALFESAGARARGGAAGAVPLPGVATGEAVSVRRSGRAVVREATRSRGELPGAGGGSG